jgi:hypothetical protein
MDTGALMDVTPHSSLRWRECTDGVLTPPRVAMWAQLASGAEPLDTDSFISYPRAEKNLGGRIREAR